MFQLVIGFKKIFQNGVFGDQNELKIEVGNIIH